MTRHDRPLVLRRLPGTALTAAVLTVLALAPGSGAAQAAPATPAKAPTPHSIQVGAGSTDVAIAQGIGKAFVVSDRSITAVSLLTHRPLTTFSATGKASRQLSIALMQGETQAYVTNDDTKHLSVFDTETYKPMRQINIGATSTDVTKANTAHGQRAYISLWSTSALAVVETRTGKVLPRVKLPAGAQKVATQPGGKYVWAAAGNDERLFKVNTTTGKVKTYRYKFRTGPVGGLAFSRDGKQLWLGGLGGLAQLNTRTGKVTRTRGAEKIVPDGGLGPVALGASGRYLYAASTIYSDHPIHGWIAAIDTRTLKVAHRVRGGNLPSGIAVDTHRDVLYTSNYDDNTATYFSGAK